MTVAHAPSSASPAVPAIRLIRPTTALVPAYLEALAEMRGGPTDGSGLKGDHALPTTEADAAAIIARQRSFEDPATEMPEGLVHCSHRWIVPAAVPGSAAQDAGTVPAEGPVLGFLAIRHVLNDYLFELGGHIGYSVRPSQRRRGIARAALLRGLEESAELGIDPVLVTCAEDNVASRGVIESAGGRFEEARGGARRYWFGDAPRPVGPTA